MAQNFWTAIFAWTTCFILTVIISLLTKPRPDEQLLGLVYSLTPKLKEQGLKWYQQPSTLAGVVLTAALILNWIFW
jgi:SSS family solute:Na+ symporter